MSCDEFYHRHFHKKITHTHPHSEDIHHQHTHPEGLDDHPETGFSDGSGHFHEHTHEAAEHPHPSEQDPFDPCNHSDADSNLKEKNADWEKSA